MTCSQIQQQLNDYLDGDLTEEIREQVDRHLDECLDCRREYEGLRSLVDQAGALEPEIRPSRDLWPSIHTSIGRSRPLGSSWWLQLAAAGLALAVLSLPFSAWWMGRHDRDLSTSAQIEVEDEDDSSTARAEMARAEDGVLLARTDLFTAIERHRDVIEDDTLRVWEDNMNLLDQAIGELRVALDEDPQNLRLRMLLASRYQQERKLLQKVSRV